jgi:hypothetical protein
MNAAAPEGVTCGGSVTEKFRNLKIPLSLLPAVPRRGPEAGVHRRVNDFMVIIRTPFGSVEIL